MTNYENEEYKKSNREQALTPKQGKSWCWKCDANFHPVGEKCRNCGAEPEQKKLKKETNAT